jgi:hypothetical protein
LLRSPFRRTLYLDCDSRVQHFAAGEVFELLEANQIALVEALPDASYTRKQLKRPLFNAGVIGFKQCPKIQRLFEEWQRLTLAQHQRVGEHQSVDLAILETIEDPAVRRRLLCMDQLGLVQLLAPDHNPMAINYTILQEEYNARRPARLKKNGGLVRIDHNRKHYWSLSRDLASASQSVGRHSPEEARLLDDAVIQLKNTPDTPRAAN